MYSINVMYVDLDNLFYLLFYIFSLSHYGKKIKNIFVQSFALHLLCKIACEFKVEVWFVW